MAWRPDPRPRTTGCSSCQGRWRIDPVGPVENLNRRRGVSFSLAPTRAPSCGCPGPALPRRGGAVDRSDRRAPASLAGDDQGLLLRPHGREGEGGQEPLRGGVPGLRRLHAAAQWQGRRLRLLQGMSPRRDRAILDAGAGHLAMLDWRERYGRMPSSYDWSRTHARRRGQDASQRLAAGQWPSASIVSALFGTWTAAREAAGAANRPGGRSVC
jgi:hypothetical protein